MFKGVDISSVQANVDFNWLVSKDISFIIIKCYEGNKGKDPNYDKYVKAAKAAGLKVAAYHFIYPLPTDAGHTDRDPKVQAKLHYEAAGDIPFACCDLEWPEPQDWNKWGCNADQIKKWTLDYLDEYERLSGKRMVLYTYTFFAKTLKLSDDFKKYPLWIANFNNPPSLPFPWTNYVMQQTGGGKTGVAMTLPNGIPVDTDLAKDLSLWDDATLSLGPQGPQDPVPGANGPAGPEPSPIPAPPVPQPVPEPTPTPAPAPTPTNSGNPLAQLIQAILKLFGLAK